MCEKITLCRQDWKPVLHIGDKPPLYLLHPQITGHPSHTLISIHKPMRWHGAIYLPLDLTFIHKPAHGMPTRPFPNPDPQSRLPMTQITCYPFQYLGPTIWSPSSYHSANPKPTYHTEDVPPSSESNILNTQKLPMTLLIHAIYLPPICTV